MLYLCLVVQHDPALSDATGHGLVKLGLKPYCVSTLSSAKSMLTQWRFDVVLFNTDDFGERVAETLVELRQCGLPIVVMSSAAQEEPAQIRALELGATEVVTASNSIYLTALRLRKLADVRRRPANDEQPAHVRLGSLVLDTRRVKASVGDVTMQLTPRQFDLLLLLTVRAGEFVHRQTIATTLRQRGEEGSRSVDMMVSRIRRRLRELGDMRLNLHTIYGRGYCLTFEDKPAGALEDTLQWCA